MDLRHTAPLEGGAEALPARRFRLLRPVLILLVGSALVAGAARSWDAIDHDHDGGHGQPARPAALERAMMGPFTRRDGEAVTVLDARCAGQGEGTDRGYTHFDCTLIFGDGSTDDVVVHLLQGDELFFKSSVDANG